MRYSAFYVESQKSPTNLPVGWHVGWQGSSHRVSKFGPFDDEETALRVLDRLEPCVECGQVPEVCPYCGAHKTTKEFKQTSEGL